MIQLSEKAPGETFCEQEEMVLEDKELNTLLEYLRWTFSGPNVDTFKEWFCLTRVYEDWFEFDKPNLRLVYECLLRANSRLAEMCEWRIKKLRGSDAGSETELTVYYSGIDESNIEKAVEQSNSQPMVWLAQQCITLCDHLVRQAYLLEKTKAAIEEAELSDWLKKRSETEWEPGISSFISGLPHEAQPSLEPLTTESQESEELTYEECSDCPFEHERRAGLVDCPADPSLCECGEMGGSDVNPSDTEAQKDERRKINYQKMEFFVTSLMAIFCGVAIVSAIVMFVAEAVEAVKDLNVNSREKQELVIAERFVRNA